MTDEPDARAGAHDDDGAARSSDELEVVDGLPVLAGQAPLAGPEPSPPLPAIQVAALAATGFVAGAATVAVIQRRRAKVVPRRLRARKKKGLTGVGEVITSNSFLVDVHLLRRD